MARRPTFLQNSYGPFAYAAGKSPFGDTCIYAWQQIRSGSGSGIGRDLGMIQTRWRLCDATASEQQLLSAVYGYTITGTFSGKAWNPFGAPPPLDPRLGRPGTPIYPSAAPAGAVLQAGYAGSVDRVAPARAYDRRAVPKAVRREGAVSSTQTHAVPRVPLPDFPRKHPAEAVPQGAASSQPPGAVIVKVPSPDCITAPAMKAGC
jgi:hypothetical protein